jgi:sulfide:quinone oxidoreductase
VAKHSIVIVGAGTAGTTVAARLRRAGAQDVALIDPEPEHYYQPLWTLVGGGLASASASVKPRSKTIPEGVTWIRAGATSVDPEGRAVILDNGDTVGYEQLVMAPGIQLNWGKVEGLEDTLGSNGVSSNYRYDLAPKTWNLIRGTKSGTAIFTQPAGPIKCAGAPQKIAYLAADYWKSQGILDDIDVHLVLPTPGMFGIKHFSDQLYDIATKRYGITVHFDSDLKAVDGPGRKATIRALESGETTELDYTMMHVTPPQSGPDWATNLAAEDDPFGYIAIDKNTMQHVKYPEIFALGDAGSSPNSKTGAAVRKQAPVVVDNLRATAEGRAPSASYGGYASCPLTTGRNKLLLAEFDYTMQPTPSNPLPFPDTTREVTDFHMFKKVGLPTLYWNFMLKGMA